MLAGAVLYAKNLKKMTGFYVALGGKPGDGQAGEFAIIATQDVELILLQVPEAIAEKIDITDPPTIRTSTPIKPIIRVDSIDEVLDWLPRLNGQVVPQTSRWTFRNQEVQDIVDPEGNIVQLWQPA